MTTYFSFDTETTGVEPGSRMLEIAAIHFTDKGETLSEFHRLIDPGMPIPPDSAQIHGITAADLIGRGDTKMACEEFLAWLTATNADVGVAHFAPYDIGIISWALGQHGLALPTLPVIDTCAIAKRLGETPNNKLVTCVAHYGIEMQGAAHRALADTDACKQYFCKVKDRIQLTATPWSPEYNYIPVPTTLTGLEEAVANGSPFSFRYQDQSGTITDRTITPYGWAYNRKAMVEFHGLCHWRNERRTFLAHRVQAVQAVAS